MYFSTTDNDNDNYKSNCAEVYKTAGWFNDCFHANLNGPIRKDSRNDAKELCWNDWGSTWSSLKSAKMMIRPLQCEQLKNIVLKRTNLFSVCLMLILNDTQFMRKRSAILLTFCINMGHWPRI